MEYLVEIGQKAKKASQELMKMKTFRKNEILSIAAKNLINSKNEIFEANRLDLENAAKAGLKSSFIDRLTLNEKRLEDMSNGLEQIIKLDDPVGNISDLKTVKSGIQVGKKVVPLGVICMIYEARPNVTVDAFGLCIKTGNSVILRGGKEAKNSNIAITNCIRKALSENGFNPDVVQLVEDTSRETASKLMKLNDYIDVLIPRGGSGLIKTVVENSTIPVIKTGTGNCHIYVDESADFEKASDIIINAKTQRPGVCNACEKLLIHNNIAEVFLKKIYNGLREKNVEIRGDESSVSIESQIVNATEDDWHTEYTDMIISIAIVENIESAIKHIEKYSSGHSEAIITENYTNAQRFLEEVDSAAVYVNASTRFTDGFEFGFGAEIGISTQKLHARGPMGLEALTSTKYIIYGNGEIRQ